MIKKLLLALTLFLSSISAWAVNYSVTANWTDPTVVNPGYTYTPAYNLEYRVDGGTSTPVNLIGATTWAGTIAANVGQTIEVRVQAVNTAPTPDLVGTWTAWASATAPQPYTSPGTPSTPILIVIPQ